MEGGMPRLSRGCCSTIVGVCGKAKEVNRGSAFDCGKPQSFQLELSDLLNCYPACYYGACSRYRLCLRHQETEVNYGWMSESSEVVVVVVVVVVVIFVRETSKRV
jgi:hypothetical protein